MEDNGYEGRTVVVTGCSSGLGRATAHALAGLGAHVIGLSRRAPDLELAQWVEADLASASSIDSAVSQFAGDVHALFNCAGAPPVVPSSELVRVNFLGTRLLTERLVDRMPSGSAIVNVASSNAIAWRRNIGTLSSFLATKTFQEGVEWYGENEEVAGHGYPFGKEALTLWTKRLAVELVPRGIRVNSTSPGAVDTPLLETARQAFPAEFLASTLEPSGRSSTVAEQVEPLLFLGSPAASYITGANLAVDGGYAALHTS